MKRDIERLATEVFDLLVIGGGSHGAAAAREAARRGLSVALVEQGDFGSATSANSLKIIHGGLRYLQHADFGKMRAAVRARRQMFRLFPHLVSPLPCVIPTYGHGVRSRTALGLALALNDALSFDRNEGIPSASRLPRGRVISRAEMLRIAPEIPGPPPTGGALWHDGLAHDTERIVLELAAAATARGAAAANYVRAEKLLRTGDRIQGARARDLLGNAPFEIRARVVLNAGGPWFDLVNGPLGSGARLPLAKAVNVLIGRPLFGHYAVGLAGAGGRSYFFVPWRGGTMVGTLYRPHDGAPGECAVTAQDIEEMTAEIDRLYPTARIGPEDVRFAHVGLLPLGSRDGTMPAEGRLLGHPVVVDGRRAYGVDGLVAVQSVKYTTACLVAEAAVALVAKKLGRALPAPAGEEPPGAGCAPAHGTGAGCDSSTLAAPIRRAVREEMAQTLCDLVFRRTQLGTLGHPGQEALAACAAVAAAELGWDASRREREIDLVEAEFRRFTGTGAP